MAAKITKLNDDTFMLTDRLIRVNQFLLRGKKSALLLDTGYGGENFLKAVKKLAALPVTERTKATEALQQLLLGGMLLGAIFMATDYVTSPMTHKGMVIYGICIGLLTIIIRRWGAYPEGMSFAILIMNAVTPLINKYVKPKRFGEVKK